MAVLRRWNGARTTATTERTVRRAGSATNRSRRVARPIRAKNTLANRPSGFQIASTIRASGAINGRKTSIKRRPTRVAVSHQATR